MSNLPTDFNPATLLYLNPELQAYSNIVTIEEARDYYLLKGSNADLLYNLSNLPSGFDSRIFISDNKDGLNISDMNRTIKQAMINDGYTNYDLQVFGQYQPTIYRDLRIVGTNTFAYADLTYQITASNLFVGDDVKIVVNNVESAFGEVITADPATNTFSISNFYGMPYSNMGGDSTFLLYGHKIWDFERLGRVNWARNNRSSNPIYGDFSNRYYGLDPDFNVELYKLLYPDARILTSEQCILDYTARRNDSDIRIGKSTEIVSEIAFLFTDLLNLDVSCNLKADGNFILGNYWVNGITSNSIRSSDFSSDSNLITEKGAKGYLDQFLKGTMVLNNLIVDSNATFCNTVGMLSNLDVYGITYLMNDAYVIGNSFLQSNLSVTHDAFFGNDFLLSNDMVVNSNATICNNLFVANKTCLSNDVVIYGTSTIDGEFDLIGDGEIWGHLHVHSDTNMASNVNLSNNLFVGGSAQVNCNLYVESNANIQNDVNVFQNVWIAGNIGLSNTLRVLGSTDLWGSLMVGGDISLSNDINVDNNAYISNDLLASGNTYVSCSVYSGCNVSMSNDLDVFGKGRFYETVQINSNLSLSNDLCVTGNVFVNSNISIAGNVSLSNELDVFGIACLWASTNIGCNLSLSNDLRVGENAYINSDLTISGNSYVSQSVFVGSNVSLSNDVDVFGNGRFYHDLTVASNLSLSNDLYVCGNSYLDQNLNVNGNACLSNDIDIYGDTRVHQNMEISSNASISNDITVLGNANIVTSLSVAGNVGFSNQLYVYGNTILSSNLTVSGDATFCNDVFVDGQCSLFGTVAFASTVVLSNNLYVNSNVDVLQTVNVGNNVGISNNLNVCGNTYLMQDTFVANDMEISGDANVMGSLSLSNGLFVDGPTSLSNSLHVQETATVFGDIFGLCNIGISGSALFSESVEINGDVTMCNSLAISGLVKIGTQNTIGNLVLDASGSIRCDEYLLTSDERVKKDINFLSTDRCYEVMKNAPVISYKLQYDPKERMRYGFLAHEIEQLDPTLVSNITDFIPNIMKKLVIKQNAVQMKDHPVKKGDRLKLYCDQDERLKTVSVVAAAKHSFKINTQEYHGRKVFVYGTEIKDFKTIDYAQMFAVSMGALKKVMEQVSCLESQVEELSSRLNVVGA